MLVKIGAGLLVIVLLFLGFVATRDGHFRYERSGVIHAPPEKIFPYISDLKKGGEWSPYEKKDPNMTKTISGPDAAVGQKMEFSGNKDVGAGNLEILKVEPTELVEIQLNMTKPFNAKNLIQYKLVPEADGTRFFWTMSGDGGFFGKLIGTLIDCEKMVTGDFEIGIANLKQVVESKK